MLLYWYLITSNSENVINAWAGWIYFIIKCYIHFWAALFNMLTIDQMCALVEMNPWTIVTGYPNSTQHLSAQYSLQTYCFSSFALKQMAYILVFCMSIFDKFHIILYIFFLLLYIILIVWTVIALDGQVAPCMAASATSVWMYHFRICSRWISETSTQWLIPSSFWH